MMEIPVYVNEMYEAYLIYATNEGISPISENSYASNILRAVQNDMRFDYRSFGSHSFCEVLENADIKLPGGGL